MSNALKIWLRNTDGLDSQKGRAAFLSARRSHRVGLKAPSLRYWLSVGVGFLPRVFYTL
jgi:hypothetical protein